MSERICTECKVTETKEDLYEDYEGKLLCTVCMVRYIEGRTKIES